MTRWFNTAGPCKPGYHYMLPPARRIPQVRVVIDQMQYFVLHAPRQTGKTTIFDERPQAEATGVRTRRERGRSPAGREITVIHA